MEVDQRRVPNGCAASRRVSCPFWARKGQGRSETPRPDRRKNQHIEEPVPGAPPAGERLREPQAAVSWAVLSHNLWLLARLRIEQEEARRSQEQARKNAA